jgi:hypothetical protein
MSVLNGLVDVYKEVVMSSDLVPLYSERVPY